MSTVRLTTPQVTAMLGVTHLTLLNWRKGATTSKTPLPTLKPAKGEPPNAVRFAKSAVIAWAKKNGVEVVEPNPEAPRPTRRGPKTKK